MSQPKAERYRLSIDITREQHLRSMRLFPWGIKGRLFATILDQVLDATEEYGELALAAIITGKITILEVLKHGEHRLPQGEHNSNATRASDEPPEGHQGGS